MRWVATIATVAFLALSLTVLAQIDVPRAVTAQTKGALPANAPVQPWPASTPAAATSPAPVRMASAAPVAGPWPATPPPMEAPTPRIAARALPSEPAGPPPFTPRWDIGPRVAPVAGPPPAAAPSAHKPAAAVHSSSPSKHSTAQADKRPPLHVTTPHAPPRGVYGPPSRDASRYGPSPRDGSDARYYDPRDDRYGPPRREASRGAAAPRDDRGGPSTADRRNGSTHLSPAARRALIREYDKYARRQLEIERALGAGQPPKRDRYSDASGRSQ